MPNGLRRITLAEQRELITLLQGTLKVLRAVDYHVRARDTDQSPPSTIGWTKGDVEQALRKLGAHVEPVGRLDVDDAGEPRIVEGTAVVVEREPQLAVAHA